MRQSIADRPRGASTVPETPLDPERGAAALARWRLRHGRPDALARWHEAGPGRGGALAFTAIAQDPFALTRMRPAAASLLANDAGDHADRLAASLPAEAGSPTPVGAAVAQVRVAVAAWRRSLERRSAERRPPERRTLAEALRARPRGTDGDGAEPPPAGSGTGPLDRLDEGAGRAATDAVARLGASGLARMALPESRALAGAVTRFVGGTLLSGAPDRPAWEAVSRALLALQGHAASVGATLLLAEDYGSAVLTPGAVAARLSADLAVCGAAARVGDGARAPGFPVWAAAEEAHACAALALDVAAPAALPPAAAARLLRAARRGASGPAPVLAGPSPGPGPAGPVPAAPSGGSRTQP